MLISGKKKKKKTLLNTSTVISQKNTSEQNNARLSPYLHENTPKTRLKKLTLHAKFKMLTKTQNVSRRARAPVRLLFS